MKREDKRFWNESEHALRDFIHRTWFYYETVWRKNDMAGKITASHKN